jgi:uncharacterized protein YunC (DUF1805 family)
MKNNGPNSFLKFVRKCCYCGPLNLVLNNNNIIVVVRICGIKALEPINEKPQNFQDDSCSETHTSIHMTDSLQAYPA